MWSTGSQGLETSVWLQQRLYKQTSIQKFLIGQYSVYCGLSSLQTFHDSPWLPILEKGSCILLQNTLRRLVNCPEISLISILTGFLLKLGRKLRLMAHLLWPQMILFISKPGSSQDVALFASLNRVAKARCIFVLEFFKARFLRSQGGEDVVPIFGLDVDSGHLWVAPKFGLILSCLLDLMLCGSHYTTTHTCYAT